MKKVFNLCIVFLCVLMIPACGGNDEEENNNVKTGKIIPIDSQNFYLDNIRYNIMDGSLVVTGCDREKFDGSAKIPSSIEYNAKTYNVTAISQNAFKNCTSLITIELPNTVTTIGSGAFSGCSNLTSIDIPDAITEILADVFYNCSNLRTVNIPEGVLFIKYAAFANCTSLASVVIPNSVVRIEENVFNGCKELQKMTLGKSLQTIQRFVFDNCPSLKEVHCLAEKPFWIDNESIFPKGLTLYVPKGCLEAYTNSLWVIYFEKILEE